MRLYVLQLGLLPAFDDTALPGYLIQTDDGTNVLIDTGYSRSLRGRQAQADDDLLAAHPDDPVMAFGAELVRNLRDDAEDVIINRLAALGLTPRDISYLVCTHFDLDHAGNHDLFESAELVVQRRHYDVARQDPRFRLCGTSWEAPGLRFRFLDGDTELLPGIELIETSGHVPGHQSVLVRLPETGPILLAIDAITGPEFLAPDAPEMLQDMDPIAKRASVAKLQALIAREGVALTIYGHDAAQWRSLRKSPEFYA